MMLRHLRGRATIMTNRNRAGAPWVTFLREPATLFARHWRVALICVAALLGITGRVTYGWRAPFWFDETFSGVVASQPNFRALIDWCLTELTGPAFYVPLWFWEKLAGSSDAALRAPSLIFSLAAPLLIYWKGHPDRDIRLFWAIAALLWLPAMTVATDARPYSQLFFLAAAQAIAFLRLMRTPARSRALAWTTITAIMILTNYNALMISGVQGLIYLAFHRRAALATWPAALPFLVVAAWMAVHIPFLLSFDASRGTAYYSLPLSQVTLLPAWLFGIAIPGTIILGTILISQASALRSAGRLAMPTLTPERLLAISGVIAFAMIFASAFLRPAVAPRYAIPCMPAVLFAVALWERSQRQRDPKLLVIVLAMLFLIAAGLIRLALTEPDPDGRHRFNLEEPSAWLSESNPRRLLYLWDSPTGAISGRDHLAQVGGFFFKRAGREIPVTMISVPQDVDPNRAVLAAADAEAGTAILWMANDALAVDRKPHIGALDARWKCRDFGGGQVTNTACYRVP